MKLDWPDCRNVRDLGGTPTTGDGEIRTGALIRADSLGLLTPTTQATLREATLREPASQGQRQTQRQGIALILDLRWPHECVQDPNPFAGEAVYRNVPMLDYPLAYEPPDDTYAPMLDHHGERIARALRTVAAAPPGGVVVHCHGGRDRTGLLVALLLTVAGVDPDTIAEDFARTPGCEASAMRDTLTHAERRHGGVLAYLREAGVPAGDLTAIRQRLSQAARSPAA
ncbi:hypothetical protein FB565_003405 [Actinoplanes lutulentus]|uniref:Protein tyrosine/serine phosphatase n=1 Tax=Actinoplanes lutulentus TaxID=1287878 RepID=A0A327Z2P7_9ACTN|nr:tyrosine-protein phosphatase [Actinoplanes lutulentus]MBB2943676.1 hypothetical protein [Actinoplanes lutulentus]RAK29221.1 protein tyrosine/serine phosphatase [Actinoplanes lutulentus]